MRTMSSVTSVSWIPSEAVPRGMRLPFDWGVLHYDDPPPDALGDLETWRAGDRFRFANELRAWIEVASGRITEFGHAGQGHMGSTTVRLGRRVVTFPAVAYPDLRPEPEVGDGWVRFVQTAGCRTWVPMPRAVKRPPFVQLAPPATWTTLALTLHADGRVEHEVAGASAFPRHWVYDDDGRLVAKSGLADFSNWSMEAFGAHTPWGKVDSPALVTEAETTLERELSTTIMRGGVSPEFRRLEAEETLTEQGEPGAELYLLLDGVLRVEVDGEPVAELGPGAILGERALLEGGRRTATLRALTRVKVAVAAADALDPEALAEVAKGHRREETAGGSAP